MNVVITWRPLTLWPAGRARTPVSDREVAKFKQPGRMEGLEGNRRYVQPRPIAVTQTLADLDSELWQINATDVVAQLDLVNGERAIRQDGQIRADARSASPAVVLTFKRNGAALVFATDHFTRWEDNLRAIAKGLEALRLLERYHINQSGEQYRGWLALPASTQAVMTTEQAAKRVAVQASIGDMASVLRDRTVARDGIRKAKSIAHPDAGGSNEAFTLIVEAERILKAHHGGAL